MMPGIVLVQVALVHLMVLAIILMCFSLLVTFMVIMLVFGSEDLIPVG